MSARIGHIHLKVSDIEVSASFYKQLLGFRITEHIQGEIIFMSSGDMHHELALQHAHPEDTISKPGLYHVAFEVDTEKEFAKKFLWLRENKFTVSGVDHGISWALYFDDPDGHGVEIYVDRRSKREGSKEWAGQSYRLDVTELERLAR